VTRESERKDRIDQAGAVMLVSFSALLGLNQVLIKLVNAGLQPVFQAGLRSVCAFFPVLLFALIMKRRLDLRDGSLLFGVIAGILFAVEFVFMFIGLDYTSVARASILFYTMPLWVALGAHWLVPGERLTLSRSLGVLCLAASFLWAAIALMVRTTAFSRASPEMQLLYQLGISAPLLLVASLFFGDWLREPTVFIWAVFVFQALVVVAFGFLLWFWVLSVYPASDMAVYSFLAPLFGVIFGWLILDETIDMRVILALILVSAGIVLVNLKKPVKTD